MNVVARNTTDLRPLLLEGALYWSDNGRVICAKCAGMPVSSAMESTHVPCFAEVHESGTRTVRTPDREHGVSIMKTIVSIILARAFAGVADASLLLSDSGPNGHSATPTGVEHWQIFTVTLGGSHLEWVDGREYNWEPLPPPPPGNGHYVTRSPVTGAVVGTPDFSGSLPNPQSGGTYTGTGVAGTGGNWRRN